jgi:hypothetical protein
LRQELRIKKYIAYIYNGKFILDTFDFNNFNNYSFHI